MSRARALLSNLALAGASFLACLLVLEGAARIAVWRWTRLPNPIRAPFARYDPLLGWSKPPGADGWLVRPEYRTHLRINSRGLRGPEYGYEKPGGVRRVLLLGDSFTEGYTVDEENSVRARLEAALQAKGCARHQVLNGGTAAWGTEQEYLFWSAEGRRYAPDVVVLLFYYNDLYGDGFGGVGKPGFDVVGDDDRLVLRDSPVPPPRRAPESNRFRMTPWRGSLALRFLSQRAGARAGLHRRLARWGLVEPSGEGEKEEDEPEPPAELNPFGLRAFRETQARWRVTAALLRELDREVRATGGSLVAFYVPARFEVDDEAWLRTRERHGLVSRRWDHARVFEALAEICGRAGVPLVDPRLEMRRAEADGRRTYFPLDGHWTALGHDLAADALARHLRERNLAGCN